MGSAWSRRRALPAGDVQSRVLANTLTHDTSPAPAASDPDQQEDQEVDDDGATGDGADSSVTAISQPLADLTPDAPHDLVAGNPVSQHGTSGLTPCAVQYSPADTGTKIAGHPVRKKLLDRVKQMYADRRGKLFFLVAVCFSLFAAFRLLPQLTRKSTEAPQFFSASSGIVDFHRGEMTKLSLRVLEHEVAFVLYYAHWDLDSMRYKSEHEAVAKVYGQEIFFAAINCWWPEGECSKVMRLKRFPVLLAHVRNVGDVEYRGPLVPSYIIPFLDSVLDPVIPIQNPGELLDLRSRHDAVISRYFDFRDSAQPYGYNNYLSLAVKSLAVDPWRRVQFTIVTSRKAAYKTRVTRPTSLYMFMWNSSLEVSVDDDRHQYDDMIRWIQDTLHERGTLVNWITPNGVKSNLLNAAMARDPTFILFTPRTSLFGISPYFEILREVVMDYYNCDKSSMVRSLIHRSILRRLLMEQRLLQLEEKCHEIQDPKSVLREINSDSCCFTDKFPLTTELRKKQCLCTLCVQADVSKYPSAGRGFDCHSHLTKHFRNIDLENYVNRSVMYCNDISFSFQPPYTPYYNVQFACSAHFQSDAVPLLPPLEGVSGEELDSGSQRDPFFPFIEMLVSPKTDDRIQRMVETFERQYCSKLRMGLQYNDFPFPEHSESSQDWRTNFTGLGCQQNGTLRFLAMDSVLFPAFAESAGMNVSLVTHKTLAFIIDQKNENIFLLHHDLPRTASEAQNLITKKEVYEFIRNFTTGSLTRYLRVHGGDISASDQCLPGKRDVVCVPELTSDTFDSVVMQNGKDVVVFYYTPWCGFCTSIAHVYLSVARFFAGVKEIVFTRINMQRGDLPTKYSVDRFPTIIFFPAHRKSDSVVYPTNMPITTTSLIQFSIANAQPLVRRQASFELCGRSCLLKNLAAYTSEERKVRRRLRTTRADLHRLNWQVIRPGRFRHEKHEHECREFAKHLSAKRRRLESSFKSLGTLLDLLGARIRRFVTGPQSELTRDLLQDMLMLIREPAWQRTAAQKAIKKRKAKKSGGKRKKQDRDEL